MTVADEGERCKTRFQVTSVADAPLGLDLIFPGQQCFHVLEASLLEPAVFFQPRWVEGVEVGTHAAHDEWHHTIFHGALHCHPLQCGDVQRIVHRLSGQVSMFQSHMIFQFVCARVLVFAAFRGTHEGFLLWRVVRRRCCCHACRFHGVCSGWR